MRSVPLFALATLALLALTARPSPLPAADVREGLKLLEHGDPQGLPRAEEIFSAALAAAPDDEQPHLGLAYVRILQYMSATPRDATLLEDGLRHADAVLKRNPLQEDARYKKSQLLFFLGRNEDGHLNLLEGLKRNPGSAKLHEALLVYLLNIGLLKEARDLSRNPDSAVADLPALHLRFGRAWIKAGRPLYARESFTLSDSLGPSQEASEGITRTYLIANDSSGAIEHLLVHLQNYPDDQDAQESLAMSYEEVGEKIKARLLWTKLRAQAGDPEVRQRAEEHIDELGRKDAD